MPKCFINIRSVKFINYQPDTIKFIAMEIEFCPAATTYAFFPIFTDSL